MSSSSSPTLPNARLWGYVHQSHRSSSQVEELVIFGDSYSSSAMTWQTMLPDLTTRRLSVRNYAFPGATVEHDLEDQVNAFRKTNRGTVIWMGINDCGQRDEYELGEIADQVCDAVNDLYVRSGARCFVLVDAPPLDRSPGGERHWQRLKDGGVDFGPRYQAWNEKMLEKARAFADETPRATLAVLSSHAIISALLDNPEAYGLRIDAEADEEEYLDEDYHSEEGSSHSSRSSGLLEFWEDELHVSQAVHSILAHSFASALPL
ncbi:hypothetical protein DL93DRAFT_2162890 [Clavulina sp. PMI_390]|nr:hypothetical protein DL93DRAFT_2162890 [Clavulina sp. PMI_390]